MGFGQIGIIYPELQLDWDFNWSVVDTIKQLGYHNLFSLQQVCTTLSRHMFSLFPTVTLVLYMSVGGFNTIKELLNK